MKRSLLVCLVALGLLTCTSARAIEVLANGSMDLTVGYNPNPMMPAVFAPQPASWSVTSTKTLGHLHGFALANLGQAPPRRP